MQQVIACIDRYMKDELRADKGERTFFALDVECLKKGVVTVDSSVPPPPLLDQSIMTATVVFLLW